MKKTYVPSKKLAAILAGKRIASLSQWKGGFPATRNYHERNFLHETHEEPEACC